MCLTKHQRGLGLLNKAHVHNISSGPVPHGWVQAQPIAWPGIMRAAGLLAMADPRNSISLSYWRPIPRVLDAKAQKCMKTQTE